MEHETYYVFVQDEKEQAFTSAVAYNFHDLSALHVAHDAGPAVSDGRAHVNTWPT